MRPDCVLAAQLEGVSGGPAGAGIEQIAAALRMKSPEKWRENGRFPNTGKGQATITSVTLKNPHCASE
jgi:hypothetical protein